MLHRDLEVVSISRERWATTLTDSGLPLPTAQSPAELYAASEDGLLAPRGDRTLVMDTALKTPWPDCWPPAFTEFPHPCPPR